MSIFSISAQARVALSAQQRLAAEDPHFQWRWEYLAEQMQQYVQDLDREFTSRLRIVVPSFEVVPEMVSFLFRRAPEIRAVSLSAVEFRAAAECFDLGGKIYHLDVRQDLLGLQIRLRQHLVCRLLMHTSPPHALLRARADVVGSLHTFNKKLSAAPSNQPADKTETEADARNNLRQDRALELAEGVKGVRPSDLVLFAVQAIREVGRRRYEIVSLTTLQALLQQTWPDLIKTPDEARAAINKAKKEGLLAEVSVRFKNEFHSKVKLTPEGVLRLSKLRE